MDNLQLSSASRKFRRQGCARKIESELTCTGDRLRCGCRACKFYRREHWGLSALSSSEESSSEDEDGGGGCQSSRHYHQGSSLSNASQNSYYTENHPRQDMVKYTFSIHDDFSRDDKEEEVRCSSAGTQNKDKESWSRSSWTSIPAFNNPDPPNGQAYSLMASAHHADSRHRSRQGIKTSKHMESTMIEENKMASNQVRDPLYKSIQERCDHIMDMLDPCRLREKVKDISPGLDRKKSGDVLIEREDRNCDGNRMVSLKGPLTEGGIDVLVENTGEEHDQEEVVGAGQYTSTGNDDVQESSIQSKAKSTADFYDVRFGTVSEELCEDERIDGDGSDDGVEEAGYFIMAGEETQILGLKSQMELRK